MPADKHLNKLSYATNKQFFERLNTNALAYKCR